MWLVWILLFAVSTWFFGRPLRTCPRLPSKPKSVSNWSQLFTNFISILTYRFDFWRLSRYRPSPTTPPLTFNLLICHLQYYLHHEWSHLLVRSIARPIVDLRRTFLGNFISFSQLEQVYCDSSAPLLQFHDISVLVAPSSEEDAVYRIGLSSGTLGLSVHWQLVFGWTCITHIQCRLVNGTWFIQLTKDKIHLGWLQIPDFAFTSCTAWKHAQSNVWMQWPLLDRMIPQMIIWIAILRLVWISLRRHADAVVVRYPWECETDAQLYSLKDVNPLVAPTPSPIKEKLSKHVRAASDSHL